MDRTDARAGTPAWAWISFVVVGRLLLSRAFACATPFAALATLAAAMPRRREAVTLLLATWLGNQAIGFGLMHYPGTASTVGWGLAIGVATFAAWGAARGVGRFGPASPAIRTGLSLTAAFAGYESTLLLATLVLPSGHGAFAAPVLLRILAINAVALLLLLAARRLAGVAGSAVPVRPASQRG